jgi:hypothetical protein
MSLFYYKYQLMIFPAFFPWSGTLITNLQNKLLTTTFQISIEL